MEEITFLKDRAREFWEEAIRLFNEGKYNLSAFCLEQAIQLWLKYLIGIKVAEWPKIHYLSHLIKELVKIYKKEKILEFYEKEELFFENLEDAYFTSRYFPKTFSKNLVEKLIEKSKEFLKILENETGEKFQE